MCAEQKGNENDVTSFEGYVRKFDTWLYEFQ